jgi:small subunit ribosomal protein S3Ae
MAIGKNKRKPKKTAKKRLVDPMSKKDWYDVKVPNIFDKTDIGKTFVNQTAGKVLASDGLRGRVFAVSLADLNKDEDRAYRTMKFVVEDVQGKNCLTNFQGMTFTSDKVKGLIKKWQSLIEANVEVKTTDGFTLRLYAVGFTKKRPNQVKLTTYAKSSQIKRIRKKMVDIMIREAQSVDLKGLFQKFIPETIGRFIEAETQGIYPLKDCYIRQAKILRRPKFEPYKLAELHAETSAKTEDVGTPVVASETVAETPKEVVGATLKK